MVPETNIVAYLLDQLDRFNSMPVLNSKDFYSYKETIRQLSDLGIPLGADRIADEAFLNQDVMFFSVPSMSARVRSFVANNKIQTVADILNITRDKCLKLPKSGNAMWLELYMVQKQLLKKAESSVAASSDHGSQVIGHPVSLVKFDRTELFRINRELVYNETEPLDQHCRKLVSDLRLRGQLRSSAFEDIEPYNIKLTNIHLPLTVWQITSKLGTQTVSQIMDVTREDAMRLARVGMAKWKEFVEYKKKILEHPEEILEVLKAKTIVHFLPVLDDSQMALPTYRKITIGLRQMLDCMRQVGKQRDADIFERVILKNEDMRTVANDFGLFSERIRQIVVRITKLIMYDSRLADYENIFFDQELTTELVDISKDCLYLPLSVFAAKIQVEEGDTEYLPTLVKLVNLDIFSKTKDRIYQDQEYLIPKGETAYMYQHVRAFHDILCDKPFHVSKDRLFKEIMSNTSVDHEWDIEVLEGVYSYHRWIERDDSNDTCLMDYAHLSTAEVKMARIIYLNKPAEVDKNLCAQYEQTHYGDMHTFFFVNRHICFPEIVYGQKKGTYRYSATEVPAMPALRLAIHNYAKQNVIFSASKMMASLKSLNYNGFSDKTFRKYALELCVSSVDDPDILCLEEMVDEHPETKWRSRTIYGTANWYVNKCVSILRNASSGMKVRDLLREVLSSEEAENYNRKYLSLVDIEKYCCYEDDSEKDGLFILANNGRIRLNEHAIRENLVDLRKIGLKGKSPIYYETVSREIIKQLKEAEGNKMKMADLLTMCKDMIGRTNRSYIFYKIVNKLSDSVEKTTEDNVTYLRLIDR